MTILVTGGAGFIGSALVRYLIQHTDVRVINVDKLTYAGNLESLAEVSAGPRYAFERVDICNRDELERIFLQYQPSAVMCWAAEPYVNCSIDDLATFVMLWVFPGFVCSFYVISKMVGLQCKCMD